MSVEHQGSTAKKKRASGPKSARESDMHATTRLSRRRKGYRPKARNALYQLVGEFKSRHPQTTAADAWGHFLAVATTGAHEALISAAGDRLEYRPDLDKFATRTIARRTFFNQWYKVAAEGDMP